MSRICYNYVKIHRNQQKRLFRSELHCKGEDFMSNICPCTLGNSVAGALFNLRNAKKLSQEHPEQTASAIVLSRKVETCYSLTKSDSSWVYLVTFQLENEEEIQLNVTETDFKKLKEGTSLSITWKGENLTSFIIELG